MPDKSPAFLLEVFFIFYHIVGIPLIVFRDIKLLLDAYNITNFSIIRDDGVFAGICCINFYISQLLTSNSKLYQITAFFTSILLLITLIGLMLAGRWTALLAISLILVIVAVFCFEPYRR